MRSKLSYANVMATIAIFIALGGSSYAAITITGKNVKNNSLTGADIKNNSLRGNDIGAEAVNSDDVKNGALLAVDFKSGQLPQGPKGDKGETGAKGETGTVDTSSFYDKAQSDARYLATTGKAADADKLDGLDSTAFLGQSGALTARINDPAVDSTDNGIAVLSYGAVSGLSAATGDVSSVETLSPARAMIARDLAMRYTNTAGAGSINVVLMVDGVDTDYRCGIAGPAESSCTNTGTLAVPAGSRVAFQVRQYATGAAGTNPGDVMVGIRLTSP